MSVDPALSVKDLWPSERPAGTGDAGLAGCSVDPAIGDGWSCSGTVSIAVTRRVALSVVTLSLVASAVLPVTWISAVTAFDGGNSGAGPFTAAFIN